RLGGRGGSCHWRPSVSGHVRIERIFPRFRRQCKVITSVSNHLIQMELLYDPQLIRAALTVTRAPARVSLSKRQERLREVIAMKKRLGGIVLVSLLQIAALAQGPWSAPVNLGAPVNDSIADFQPAISPDG